MSFARIPVDCCATISLQWVHIYIEKTTTLMNVVESSTTQSRSAHQRTTHAYSLHARRARHATPPVGCCGDSSAKRDRVGHSPSYTASEQHNNSVNALCRLRYSTTPVSYLQRRPTRTDVSDAYIIMLNYC